MDVQFPDSPEAVALALFCLLFAEERNRATNVSTVSWALDLFAQCLNTVNGQRCRCLRTSETQH